MFTLQNGPVLLLPVFQIICPSLPCEAAALFFTGVSSVHLLVSFQTVGESESHLASFIGALVRGQLGMLLTHVGFQLLVLLKLEVAALKFANILLLLLAMNTADVSGPVGVGGEGLVAAIRGAQERLHAGVTELMSREVVGTTERLSAAVTRTRVRPYSRVFAQVSVQFPLFVISRRAVGKRANVTFVWLRFSFHFCGKDK